MGNATLAAEFFRRITRLPLVCYHQFLGRPLLLTRDPLAMAVALEPGIVHKAERHCVLIELAGQHARQ